MVRTYIYYFINFFKIKLRFGYKSFIKSLVRLGKNERSKKSHRHLLFFNYHAGQWSGKYLYVIKATNAMKAQAWGIFLRKRIVPSSSFSGSLPSTFSLAACDLTSSLLSFLRYSSRFVSSTVIECCSAGSATSLLLST